MTKFPNLKKIPYPQGKPVKVEASAEHDAEIAALSENLEFQALLEQSIEEAKENGVVSLDDVKKLFDDR